MTVWLKRVLIGLVAIIIVALVGIAIFLLTFDPNAYKHKVQEIVYERYQRTLTINGEIELSLFPRIGLAIHDATLSQRNSDERFASVDSARVAVAIWPLLSNHFVIDHVSVTGFSAWIERSGDGKLNFQDLLHGGDATTLAGAVVQAAGAAVSPSSSPAGTGTAETASTPSGDGGASAVAPAQDAKSPWSVAPRPASGDMQIDIAGLDLKGGALHFLDEASGQSLQLSALDIKTGRITSDLPFDVAVKGRLQGETPLADAAIEGQAQVQFSLARKVYAAQKLNIQAVGRLPGLQARQAVLRGNLSYSAYSQILNVSALELLVQGDLDAERAITDLNVSLTAPQLNLNRGEMELQLSRLALRTRGNWADGQAFDVAFDAPALSVSPLAASGEAVSGTLKLTGPSTFGMGFSLSGIGGNADSLTFREVKLETALKQGDRLTRIDLISPATWSTSKLMGGLSAIKGDVRIDDPLLANGGVSFPLIGSLALDVPKELLQLDINGVLDGSKLDFKLQTQPLRNPKFQFALAVDAWNLDALLGVAAPKPDGEQPDSAAEPKDKAESPAADNQPADTEPEPVPVLDLRWLDNLDATGTIKAGALHWRKFEISDLDVALKASQGKLDVTRLNAGLYGGTLKGTFSIASDAAAQAKLTLDQVDLAPLQQALLGRNHLSGQGTLALDLKTVLGPWPASAAQLGGSARVRIRDGAVHGFNADQTLRDLSQAIRGAFQEPLPQASLRFDPARQTTFSAFDASLGLDKGVATVKSLSVTAPHLRVRQGKPAWLNLGTQQLDLVLNVSVVNTGRQEGRELRALQGVSVPVRVHGAFQDPNYEVVWKEVGSQVVQQAVRRGLVEALVGDDGDAVELPEALLPPRPTEPKRDALRGLGEALKGMLR